MSLLESLGMQGLMGQNHQQLAQQANQAFNNAYNQYSSQLQNTNVLYNQAAMQAQPIWVFNGTSCKIKEFADLIWANDCPEKTHFLLKYE